MKLRQEGLHLRNENFGIREEDGCYFFIHKNGYKVQTDELGKMIWKSLPGYAHEIAERVREKMGVDDQLIHEFLYVLRRAQVTKFSLKKGEDVSPFAANSVQQKDLVSVVVVTYNGEKHVTDCFLSIINQTYKNFEIIAVDNCSQDKTTEIIRERFPQVRLFRLRKNYHFAGAVNYGIEKGKGKYYFVLNQDIELESDCIFHLYQEAESKKRAGAVVPMMKFFHLRGFINGIGNHIREYSWGSDNYIGCVDIGQFSDLEEVPSACFGSVFLNAEAIEHIGLLDKKYKAYYEDIDWSFRCWLQGWRIVPSVKSVVYHKFGASYTDKSKLKFVARNRLRMILKTFQGRKMLGFLRRYVREDLKNFLSLLWNKKYDLAVAYLIAYLSLFLSLPDIFIKRKKLMREKLRDKTENDVLRMNPEFIGCLNMDNVPVVNSDVIIEYYRPELIQKKRMLFDPEGD